MKDIILIPRVSEKAYYLSTTKNTFVFNVPMSINKIEVKKAVEAQFAVEVKDVNITRHNGKVKRAMTNKRRSIEATRSDSKRAYVTLKEGHSLPIFASLEEASNPTPAVETKKTSKKEAK